MRTRRRELEIIHESLHRTGRLRRTYLAHVCYLIKMYKEQDNISYYNKQHLEMCEDIVSTYRTYLKHSHLRLVA